MTGPGRRRGRRSAGQDTKAALLAAAREVFAERGFEAATVRMIASRCDVDPAMVNHWFGSKQGLFLAAVGSPAVPAASISAVLLDGREWESPGEQLVTIFLTMCDDAAGGEFAALVRSIGSQQDLAARMLGGLVRDIVHPVVASLRLDRLELRAALCSAQIIGLGMSRYILGTEPLASADPETVASMVAPSIQYYLTENSENAVHRRAACPLNPS